MYWLIGIGGLFVGFFLGVIMTFGSQREKFGNWKSISMKVTSQSTGLEYHADRFRFSLEDNTPYLRIYNINRFEWFPIWHFKNPYLIMMVVEPDYAKEHIFDLCSAGSVQKFTKTAKK